MSRVSRLLVQLVGLSVIGAVVVVVWLVLAAQDPAAQQEQGGRAAGAIPVERYQARFGTVEDVLEAVGTTLALESVDVVAQVAGRVTAIRFQEGAQVSQGDVLFELDRSREQAELREAMAQRDDARTKLQRAQALLRANDISQAQVDELAAALDSAEARVEVARTRLEERTIRAPFDGITGLREVSLGAYVEPGTRLTTLDDLSVVRLDFSVPERFLGALRPGLTVQARNIAFIEQVFEGEVTRVGSRVDPLSRSVRVQAELPNPDGRLRSGMFVTTRLVLGRRDDAVLVPEEALLSEGQRVYVFLIDDGVAHRVPVTLGQRRGGMVEIREGVMAGDWVVTAGLQRLRDGVTVRVVGEEPDNGRLAERTIDPRGGLQ